MGYYKLIVDEKVWKWEQANECGNKKKEEEKTQKISKDKEIGLRFSCVRLFVRLSAAPDFLWSLTSIKRKDKIL